MNHGLDPSSYGDVLLNFDGIFDLPFVAIPNPITGAKIYITTQGILFQGERKNPDTQKKQTVRDIIYWSTIEKEPDIINDSKIIPLFRIPFKSAYTIRGRLNMYNKEAVDITGLSKKQVDIIMSALTITKEFKDPKDRKIALHIWKDLGKKRKTTEIGYYYNKMSKMIIDKELKPINYVIFDNVRIDITSEQQRNKIIAKAKELVDSNIFKYDYLKKSTSIDIANQVVKDFPEIIGKHQQFTASIASDSASIETEEGRQEKENDGIFTYHKPAWMDESKTHSTGRRKGTKSNRQNRSRRTTSQKTGHTVGDGLFTYHKPVWTKKQEGREVN